MMVSFFVIRGEVWVCGFVFVFALGKEKGDEWAMGLTIVAVAEDAVRVGRASKEMVWNAMASRQR